MRLLKLRMENFRQFKGVQTIDFARGEHRNVTLVYGANGTGKTTLLNAFVWAFYGKFTPDLEQPEKPINKVVWDSTPAGEPVEAAVELLLEHDERRYLVRRSIGTVKSDDDQHLGGRADVRMRRSNGPAEHPSIEIDNPNVALDSILPERLHSFFFFNGERMEALAQHSAFEEIADATKTILGLEMLDRATRHLPDVTRRFEAELRQIGSSEQQEHLRELELHRDHRERLEQKLEQERRNRAANEDELVAITQRLGELEQSRELQRRRDDIGGELEAVKARLAGSSAEMRDLISERGFLAFTAKLSHDVTSRFGDLESRGEIPAPIKRDFIARLLENERCVCGTPLEVGSEPWRNVANYGEQAGAPEIEQQWIRLDNEAKQLEANSPTLVRGIETVLQRRVADKDRERSLLEQLDELDDMMEELDHEQVQKLESRRREMQSERDEHFASMIRLEDAIKSLLVKENQASELAAKAQAQDAKAAAVQRRIAIAREAAGVIQRVYALLQDEVRETLDRKVKDTFRRVSFKPQQPEITAGFELQLWDIAADGRRVPAARSTGENSILSLSFVGGLAAMARDQADGTVGADPTLVRLLGKSGGDFPIVVDAAFGALDDSYREEVAQALPQLASQVVALLSKGQATGLVNEKLAPVRGKTYVIEYATPVPEQNEDITIDNRVYPYIRSVTSQAEEQATLREVQ